MESDPSTWSKSKARRERRHKNAQKKVGSFTSTASAFFQSLPLAELCDEEEELLQLLCNIATLKSSFMPTEVSIQMWAENRLPESYIDLCNSSSLVLVKRNDGKQSSFSKSPGPSTDPIESSCMSKQAQAYLAEMPVELTDSEVGLRDELVKIVTSHSFGPIGLRLTRLASNPLFLEQFHSVFPKYVEVRDWLDNRLPDDIESKLVEAKQKPGSGVIAAKKRKIKTDDDGYQHKKKYVVALRQDSTIRIEKSNEEWEAYRIQVQDDWFTALPEDDFSPKEEALRCAILDFLIECPHNVATLNDVCYCEQVVTAKNEFLPLYISALKWIERRIGNDVDIYHSQSGPVLALPDSVGMDEDVDTILASQNKRNHL